MPKQYDKKSLLPKRYLSHSITITGQTAVGTSTAMESLKGELVARDWKYMSAGSVMRNFAKQLGMDINDFAKYMRQHPEEGWDTRCDEVVRQEGQMNFRVIEGRRPHVFCPHSFHVLLLCPLEVRTDRRRRQEGFRHLSTEAVRRLIVERDLSDERLDVLYPGSNWPREDFDLTIHTHRMDPREIAEAIKEKHMEWYARGDKNIVHLHSIF